MELQENPTLVRHNANPALGAEAQLCVVLVMPTVFVNDEDIFFFPWGKVRMWNNTFSTLNLNFVE